MSNATAPHDGRDAALGKRDEHTGATVTRDGFVWTFKHVDDSADATAEPTLYAVTTRIPYTDRPVHENTYYVPHGQLGAFLTDFDRGDIWEYVVRVDPTTIDERDERVAWFIGFDKARADDDGDGDAGGECR